MSGHHGSIWGCSFVSPRGLPLGPPASGSIGHIQWEAQKLWYPAVWLAKAPDLISHCGHSFCTLAWLQGYLGDAPVGRGRGRVCEYWAGAGVEACRKGSKVESGEGSP